MVVERFTYFMKNKPWVGSLILLIAIGWSLFYKPLGGKYVFTGPDTKAPAAITTALNKLSNETGEVPLWQPWIFSGMPTLHAFTDVSRLYLPWQLGRLLQFLGLPSFWMAYLHLIFAGFGVYVISRNLSITVGGSLFAAIGYLLMPYSITMLVHGHGSQFMTLAYLPWICWAALRLFRKTNLNTTAVLALLLGLQLLRGHVQIAYYTWMFLGLLILGMLIFKTGFTNGETSPLFRIKYLGYFSVAALAGIGLSLSLYLPVLNYTAYSIRGGGMGGGTGLDYATMWSFSFGETMTFLLPSFYGFGGITYWGNMPFTDYPNYMGILILSLAILAIWRERNWITWIFTTAAVLAYLLSLGSNFFLYKLFYSLLPYFNKFRVPTMLLVLTQFSIVMLSALGFDSLIRWVTSGSPQKYRQILLGAATTVGVLTVIFLVVGQGFHFPVRANWPAPLAAQINEVRSSMITKDIYLFAAILSLGITGLAAVRFLGMSKHALVTLLVFVSMFDLLRVDKQIVEPSRNSMRASVLKPQAQMMRYLSTDPVLDYLSADRSPYRILPLGILQNEKRWAIAGINTVTGYHPAKLLNYDRLMKKTQFGSEGILRMLNVKYLVSTAKVSDSRFVETFRGMLYVSDDYKPVGVYMLESFLDRAWFPRTVAERPSTDEIIDELLSPQYDPLDLVFLIGNNETSRLNGSGQIESSQWNPMHITLQVDTDSEALLVISEVYYPEGWKALIDGDETPLTEVNTVLRGLVVPEGKHHITLDFEPDDVYTGKVLSKLSLLLILMGFVPSTIKKFSRKQP